MLFSKKIDSGRLGREFTGKIFVDFGCVHDFICVSANTRGEIETISLEATPSPAAFKTAVTPDGKQRTHMILDIAGTLDDLELWGWLYIDETQAKELGIKAPLKEPRPSCASRP